MFTPAPAAPARPVHTRAGSSTMQASWNTNPFRFVPIPVSQEKQKQCQLEETPLADVSESLSARQYRTRPPVPPPTPRPALPIRHSRTELLSHHGEDEEPCGGRCCACVPRRFRHWIPIASWIFTSLAFLVAVGFWKEEVFKQLDGLAHALRTQDDYSGHAIMFALIFITCFPPLPLYSTLQVLSGYTFGIWTGFAVSYTAALAGALAVFMLSRRFLRRRLVALLKRAPKSMQRAVRAIETQPRLLFLCRLAPYPYNVMNCLLAAAPSLTLRTYTACTALSLFKIVLHTAVGAGLHSFAHDSASVDDDSSRLNTYITVGGLVLCIILFVYLGIVARRAVDDELDLDELHEGAVRLAPDDDVEAAPRLLPPPPRRNTPSPGIPAGPSPPMTEISFPPRRL